MDVHFSDVFAVSQSALQDYGAFNISLVNDLPLFVDPFLLFNSEDFEYQRLHDDVIKYMRFLKDKSVSQQLSDGLVRAWFLFPEVKQNWLGFSMTGNEGHGLGTDFANALNRNFRRAFSDFGEEKVSQGSHIEKLTLIRRGVGRDNISDFTTNLILDYLARFTSEFAQEHISPRRRGRFRIPRARFNYETESWASGTYDLPRFRGDFVLLTPVDMLTKDEAWINRPDLLSSLPEIASALPNEELREQVNNYMMRVVPRGPKVRARDRREAMERVVDRFPEILDYYIRDKEDHGDRATDVATQRVEETQAIFVEQVRRLVQRLSATDFYAESGNTYEEAKRRLRFLKDVIEHKGGHRIFYVDGEPIRRESDAQLLYLLTWYATESDVSREVNDGRGPADFKVSRGRRDKTIVEFKLAKNSKLEQNLAKQVEVYEKASDATNPSLKAIVYFTEAELKRVKRILKNLKMEKSPHVVLIDARGDNKPPGSRA